MNLSKRVGQLLLVLACIAGHALFAQTAQIGGRVTDPSGAVIPGIDITVTNSDTKVMRKTKSNEEGYYVVPLLQPGRYQLTAQKEGFKPLSRDGIVLRVGDKVTFNLDLALGDTSEKIVVTVDTPLLAMADASLGQVVDERRVMELPLFGGSAVSLVQLAPGVVNGTTLRQSDRGSNNVNSQFSTNGSGMYNNEFSLDGVSNTISDTQGNSSSQRVAFIPPTNAVGEFKMQTVSYDASIGHTSGSLVTISTKSGSNELHGEAHWFVRNRAFDTPSIFQNRSGKEMPVYQSNRYGVAAGGPVVLPGVYSGKNRTFWFYAWEEFRHGIPQTFIASVPTEAIRRGDLSQLLALGSRYQVYDPTTTAAAAGGRFSRQPFSNNIIPSSRLDPVAQNIMKYWPLANQKGTSEGLNNWYYSEPTRTKSWVHMLRVDHSFSEKHRAYVRVNGDLWESLENQAFVNNARGYNQDRKNRGIALDDVYVFSPSFLFNFRYGLTYQKWTERRASAGTDLAALGFSPNLVALTDKKYATLPRVQVSPFGDLSSWAAGDGTGTAQTHSFTGAFTRLMGRHTFTFGTEFRVYRQNRNQNPAEISPAFTFDAGYTRGPFDNSAAPAVGGQITSFLLGIPGGYMERTGSSAEQDKYLGLYIQDDLKISPKLTLNLGLRYEIEAPVTERFDRSVAHFAYNQSNPIEAQARANYANLRQVPEVPLDSFRVLGGLTYVNTGGNPRGYWVGDKLNFMPRVGLAYQLFKSTVLRAGYGLFYDGVGVNNTASIQTGFSQSTPIQASLDSGLTYVATTANPFPNGLLSPAGASGGLKTNLGQSISFFPEKRRNPYGQRWSFGFQQVLPGQFLAEASYVGSRGTRLGVNRDINVMPLQYLSRSAVRDTATINYLSEVFPSPFAGTNSIYGANTSRSAMLRPYPQFGSITTIEPVGYSWYHSLQVRGEKRFSHGHTFQLAYTWSKTMEALERLNSADPVPYESISSMDRTHRLVLSSILELPFGRGRRFGANWSKPVNFALGNWQMDIVVQRQSGPPLAFGNVWTLFKGDPNTIKLSKGERSVDRWFNINAGFNRNSSQQLASDVRVSPLRFSGLRGDGQARWDFSAIKSFPFTERAKMQFRAECLNAWNHPNLSTPNTSPTSSAFGMITSQDVPRIWQFSLQMVF